MTPQHLSREIVKEKRDLHRKASRLENSGQTQIASAGAYNMGKSPVQS